MNPGAHVQQLVRRKAVWGSGARLLCVAALAAGAVSCGDLQREGQASSFLIINALEGASGAEPTKFGGTTYSDVITVVDEVPTVFSDLGRVRFLLALKDPGPPTSPAAPSQANYITVERYHVRFIRADGRNQPGVDVPYPFDGGMTITVTAAETSGVFELVRHLAKEEAPLRALTANNVIISTIAEVTFYGHDQTGREVSVTGRMSVDFGNFGDPQ